MKAPKTTPQASPLLAQDSGVDCPSDLAAVVDQLTTRLMSGDQVDWDVELARHPELAGSLRELIPTIGWMAALGRAPEGGLPPGSIPHRQLGDYQLIREIGRGGMGIVYEGRQASLDRRVAIKILACPVLLDERQRRRFQTEARAAAMLKHPHIVTVHSVGQDQGINYYVMELIEGPSLREIIDRIRETDGNRDRRPERDSAPGGSPILANGPSDSSPATDEDSRRVETEGLASWSTEYSGNRRAYFRDVAGLGVQAARALHFAHQQGVLHRDVKPSNLLLDSTGKLYVTDFGLARIQVDTSLTQTGDFVGTLRYTSPEQLEGRESADHRSDIYALGLTLYEMLTLRPAFAAEQRHQLAREIIEQDPRRPRQYEPSLPLDLETIILKATAKHPEDRYQHAAELADDLQRFLDHRPVLAQRTSPWGKVYRWARRNPLVAAMLTIILITLVGAAAAGLAGSVHLAQVAVEMRRQLYASDIRRAEGLLADGEIQQAIKVLDKYQRDARPQTDDRHFEWFYLRSLCDELSPKWTFGHPVGTYDAAFSPDGRQLATCTWNSRIFLWDVLTGKRIQVLPGHDSQRHAVRLQFTADGTTLLSGGNDGTIRYWDVASGKETYRLDDRNDEVESVVDFALCPQGELIAAIYRTRQSELHQRRWTTRIVIWDFRSRQQLATLSESGDISGGLRFSPDGQRLIAGTNRGRLLVWNRATWQLEKTFDAHASPIRGIAWSTDGTSVVSAGSLTHHGFIRGELKWWNPDGWQLTRVTQHHDDQIRMVDFSPDGQWVLVAANDGRVSVWQTRDGKCVRSFRPHAVRVFSARLSPDGQYLATASEDNFAKVWMATDLTRSNEASAIYEGIEEFVPALRLADNGQSVVTADISGQITKRNVSNGEILYQFRVDPPTDWRIGVAVSPDNQWLAVATGFKNPEAERGEVTIHHLSTGALQHRFATREAHLHGLEFSPNGRWLAVSSKQTVFVFDWQGGELQRQLEGFTYIKQIQWSPSGEGFSVAETSGYTSVFRLPDFGLRKTFISDDGWGTIALAYSPDGQVFATGGGSRAVKIWAADTLELQQTFEECPDWISSVSFSADGRRLLTTGKDGKVRIWHRDSGVCLLTLDLFTHDMRHSLWPMNCANVSRWSSDRGSDGQAARLALQTALCPRSRLPASESALRGGDGVAGLTNTRRTRSQADVVAIEVTSRTKMPPAATCDGRTILKGLRVRRSTGDCGKAKRRPALRLVYS